MQSITYMFDYWADRVEQLHLLKISTMHQAILFSADISIRFDAWGIAGLFDYTVVRGRLDCLPIHLGIRFSSSLCVPIKIGPFACTATAASA